MCAHVCVCVRVHMHLCICVHMYLFISMCVYVNSRASVCVHLRGGMSVRCACVCAYMGADQLSVNLGDTVSGYHVIA